MSLKNNPRYILERTDWDGDWLIGYEHDFRSAKIIVAETEQEAIAKFREANPMVISTAPVRITKNETFLFREEKGE